MVSDVTQTTPTDLSGSFQNLLVLLLDFLAHFNFATALREGPGLPSTGKNRIIKLDEQT